MKLIKDHLSSWSSHTTPPTGLESAFGSGLHSESDEKKKKCETDTNPAELDRVPRINTTSLSHQNSQVLECPRVKGQPQVEDLVPPEPSASTIISEEESSDWRSPSVAPSSDALIQESVTVKNISSAAAMETDDDITPANKGKPSGAMQPSTDEMDDRISHRPDTASPTGETTLEIKKTKKTRVLCYQK